MTTISTALMLLVLAQAPGATGRRSRRPGDCAVCRDRRFRHPPGRPGPAGPARAGSARAGRFSAGGHPRCEKSLQWSESLRKAGAKEIYFALQHDRHARSAVCGCPTRRGSGRGPDQPAIRAGWKRAASFGVPDIRDASQCRDRGSPCRPGTCPPRRGRAAARAGRRLCRGRRRSRCRSALDSPVRRQSPRPGRDGADLSRRAGRRTDDRPDPRNGLGGPWPGIRGPAVAPAGRRVKRRQRSQSPGAVGPTCGGVSGPVALLARLSCPSCPRSSPM